MTKVEAKTITFKRINDNRITLYHFGADLIALIVGHVIFMSRYKLPYFEIFSPSFPTALQPHSVSIVVSSVILIWLFAFYISGHYSNTARKSGLQILGPTLATVITISILLFFTLDNYSPIILDVNMLSLSFKYLLGIFFLVLTLRMMIIYRLQNLIKTGKRGYKKILIGNNDQALNIVSNFETAERLKNNFIGYLYEDNINQHDLSQHLPCLGDITQTDALISKANVDEAHICLQQCNHSTINHIIHILRQKEVLIRLSTDLNAMIEGTLKTQKLETLPFITIGSYNIPAWQQLLKRSIDLTMAWAGLLISAPICVILSIAIKLTSKGPIYYKQERVGQNKKSFMIYKFRSMYINAEKDGPALASINDERITKLGTFMRKWRLDELPQFMNIILGDMSFVGPRPERQYYIDQIIPKAPHYDHLFSVRPGITSWGMVKFGYAENVDEMIERLQYDILYLENRSLLVDFKILLYTIKTILNGEGK